MTIAAWLVPILLLVPRPADAQGASFPASPSAPLATDLADALAAHRPANLTWHYELMADETHATIYHPAALRALRRLFQPQ